MVERLDLNLPEIVRFRSYILSSIRDNVRRRRTARATLEALTALLVTETNPVARHDLEDAHSEVGASLREVEDSLRVLLGTEDLPES